MITSLNQVSPALMEGAMSSEPPEGYSETDSLWVTRDIKVTLNKGGNHDTKRSLYDSLTW